MPDEQNVQLLWLFFWSAADRRQQELNGGDLADHTTNILSSDNKKAQPAMRCKISPVEVGQREVWPSRA